jgi:hypothetical protein
VAYASMYFHSSAGSELSKAEKGTTWFTRSALSRKSGTACRDDGDCHGRCAT